MEEAACDDPRETIEMKKNGLKQLRQLVSEESLLDCPTNEEFLIKFLRARKYDVAKALNNIRKYFKVRRASPELFEDRNSFSTVFNKLCREHQVVTVSHKKDPEGRGVAMMRFGTWNTSICSLNDFIRMSMIQAEYMLLEEENQRRGIVIIMDFKGLSAYHLTQYTPSSIKRTFDLMQDCYPVRIKGFYVTNNPAIFDILFAIAKVFMKAKLVSRTRLFGYDLSKLHGLVPDDLIPEADGGSFESFNYDKLEEDLQTATALFNDMDRYGYATAQSKTT
ncbi:alpha-tocopherol transfer protein-like [Haemaphysalis longicornis]